MTEQRIGRISNYFGRIGVAAVDLEGPLAVGDTILIKGSSTELRQTVESMQIEHEGVQEADAGQAVGMKVDEPVRAKDIVYKVTD